MSIIDKFAPLLRRSANTLASETVRPILQWQIGAVAVLMLAAGAIAGTHGAISALLGGGINIIAGVVYAMMALGENTQPARATLRTLIRAEASKIILIVLQLWLVLTTYQNVVLLVFFTVFVITVLIFSMMSFYVPAKRSN